MPNDTSIRAVTPVSPRGESAAGQRAPPEAMPATKQASPGVPNPMLRLDPGLGQVVIQFRNTMGLVTNSIPTQRQIDAYRIWQETRIGPPPPLR